MSKKIKLFCSLALTLLLIYNTGVNISAISAESNIVKFREIIHNGPLVTQQGAVNSEVFTDENIDLSTVTVLTPKDKAVVPDGNGWIIPIGLHGNIYHYTEIEYDDGTTIIKHDAVLEIDGIDDVAEVKSITFFYTYAGNIVVNRYIDSVDPSNLLHSTSNYGRVSTNLTLIDGTQFSYDAHQLTIDPYHEGPTTVVDSLEYEFVSSNIDLSNPITYVLGEAIEVNLIYTKAPERVIGSAKVIFKIEDGEVLHTETLEGNVGEEFDVTEDYLTNKDDYELISSPDITVGTFADQPQEFVFTYKKVTTELKPDEIDEPITKPIEKPNPDETVKTEELPKTGISKNSFSFILVAAGSVLTLIKKK